VAEARRLDVPALLTAAAVAVAGGLAAGAGPINGDAAAYAAQGRAADLADRWTHLGYVALAAAVRGDPLALDLVTALAGAATVLAAASLAHGGRRGAAAAGAAAVVLPWAGFAEVDLLWICAVTLGVAARSPAGASLLVALGVAVSPAALLATPWACAVRRGPAAAVGAIGAVVLLTAASGGAWWTGERGVLEAGPLLLGRTAGAWATGLPWLLAPAWIAAGGDRRLVALAPLLLLRPDVPGWVLGGVSVAAVAAAAPIRALVLAQVLLGLGGLAVRWDRVRHESDVVAEVAAALQPDDGLIAPWTWGARVAVARTGDPYGLRWRPPTGWLRGQRAAWCSDPPRRAAVLPPGPDGVDWVDGGDVLVWSWLACGPSAQECAEQAAALLASDRGHPEAAAALGCACDGGVAEACVRLGAAHRDGAGAPQDPAASLSRYQQACDLGEGAGCNGVGAALLIAGSDVEAAHAAFERGCGARAPSARACSNAGNGLFTGRIGRQDFGAAADRFDRGCRLGDAPSCEQARVARNPAGAAARFRQGCALGDPGACLNLAVVLPLGDPERVRLLALTCAAGLDAGCALQR
jgi:hypothetical protein